MAWVLTAGETLRSRTDADAFESLYLAEYPRVHAIAMRTGLDANAAEDVAQEAFAQYHRRYPADADFASGWLRRAAAHLALNAIRTRRRREAREDRDAKAAAPLTLATGSETDPPALLAGEERRRDVQLAMAKLSERNATVLALRYSGMSYAEVGAALGIPASHVGSVLRRAEAAFKKEFENASRG